MLKREQLTSEFKLPLREFSNCQGTMNISAETTRGKPKHDKSEGSGAASQVKAVLSTRAANSMRTRRAYLTFESRIEKILSPASRILSWSEDEWR